MSEHILDKPASPQWREYTIRIPTPVASLLEKKLDEQVAMENRAIDLSEFVCWLVGMGLATRAQLVKEDRKKNKRIISPGE